MKLPAFDHTRMAWDAWMAFHVVHKHHAFVQFDTGEFVVCSNRWRPEDRTAYSSLRLRVTGTDDDDCPRLYVPSACRGAGHNADGADKPLPRSHLSHKGAQVLLLDLDHRRAVGIDRWLTTEDAPSVPARFLSRRIAAWYAGPDAAPVGSPIVRHYPQPLTHDQRRHVNGLADACKVWLQMQPDPIALRRAHCIGHSVSMKVADYAATPFSLLTPAHRTTIAINGFDMIVREEYPWLAFSATAE